MTNLEITPPTSQTASEAALVEPIPSTSTKQTSSIPRAHWEHVRHAVLPSSVPASPKNWKKVDVPPTPALKAEPPSTPSTPSLSSSGNQQKSSRFGRFALRNATDQSRTLDLSDAARSFQDDIDRACRSARSFAAGLEGSYPSTGSSITLPLPQIGHQAQGSISSITSGGFPRLGRLRRAPSLQSVATTATDGAPAHGFSQLQATLSYHASVSGLPRQTQILSVLLAPFLGGYASVKKIEDIRSFAIDIFEFIVNNWRNENAEVCQNVIWILEIRAIDPKSLLE